MLDYVKNFIKENNLENKKILIGLSGGIDSSVLCDILSKIKEIELVAIHLNHNWRGDESKRDEDFAREFALNRNIQFYSEILNSNIKKTEVQAREARYSFFEKCKKKFKADAVFLAHNKNDNVETLIYRLVKGTGPKGLNSIPKIRDFYYRPLLDFTRDKIELFAKENNINFIIDSSNFNTKYKRNLIREKIIPLMEEINPNAINSISNLIKINKMNQNIVDSIIKPKTFKKRDVFLSYPIEVQYETVNKFFHGILKNRDFKTIKKIVNFIKQNESSKLSISKNLFLKVYNNEIYLTSMDGNPKNAGISCRVTPVFADNLFSQTLTEEKKEFFCDEIILKEGINRFLNYEILIEKVEVPKNFTPNKYLNLDFKNKYILRTRKEGDLIQPFGSTTLQKLKTLFIKKKIPSEKRNKIPLIADGNEVLFVFNVIQSEKLRVDKNQKMCYKVEIKELN